MNDSLLDDVRKILGEMTDLVEESESAEELALLLKDVRAIVAEFRTFAETVEDHYVQVAGEKVLEFPGVGLVEIHRSVKRTQWRHDELWPVVVARALDERKVDPETGEFEREADTVARVLRECATPSWKVTGLRAHGVQPDEFCFESWGRHTVAFR